MEEIKQKASGLIKSADADRANAGESEEEQLQGLYWQLTTREIYSEMLNKMLKVVEDLNKNREGPNVDDLKNKDIRQLIYQQKRLMLQQFIDPERGIEVWSKQWPYMVVLLLLAPRLITNPAQLSSVIHYQAIIGGILTFLLLFTVANIVTIGTTVGVIIATIMVSHMKNSMKKS